MIIDHCGVVFKSYLSPQIYLMMRGIGRISFPIFCFLLVEGFFHTRNHHRYLSRLLLFSVLSEIPFDLALRHTILSCPLSVMDWTEQNVFFTLAFGFLAMMMIEQFPSNRLNWACFSICFACIADFCCTDYGAIGVMTILLFYLSKKTGHLPLWACLLPLLTFAITAPVQLACILSLPILMRYNGKKGKGPKFLFYVAYPVHLLLLYLMQSLLI